MSERTPGDATGGVTVLGLGAMGTALARTLLAAGHQVTVWNRTRARAEALAADGARVADTPEAAIAASPLVIVCVLDDQAVRQTLEPATAVLAGRTLINLTNGTPTQARETAAWAAGHGVDYLDGGIMAIPPMIGHPGATLLYSGSRAVFDAHHKTLEPLGVPVFLDEDPGTAALYDIALLSAMYGLFGGALHALAMVGPGAGRGTEFTATLLIPWLQAMMASVPEFARQLDAGDFGARAANSPLAMQAAAYVNLLDASEAAGVDPLLLRPMGELLHRAVAEGHGDRDVPTLGTLLRAEPR
ncbi:NAD(P)-dependent oxidoreductase [Streptomyces sp. 8K308]|uniref:NAD(P)-dependent oxidoreductase n=1 Tax=Streptomyces sp. 8K308 TaxID=2530388 RepID=UPI00104415B2|nr:NAD(P)-binding domain-containing protein [Streptomyces sp. 8K308]TDC21187.1 NAD(P)-dependent oxidoreductase [Streptomyces sp. 8K308]